MATNSSQHISQQFESELQDIRSRVLAMGGLVEQQVTHALKALKTADNEIARSVIETDQQVNELEMSIDEECIQIIALRQPTAGDLRLVSVILKTITDLERIGDEANMIARRALNLSDKDRPKKNYRELSTLGNHVRGMLRDALDAFARLDVDAALAVAREDVDVDEEYESFIRTMITYMMEDPRTISRVLDLMWSARALERIGDHARNLCEYVIYLVEGKDVRHLSVEHMEKILQRDN
ncbi:MAG TPA: phosphate signaling complex protein PhoU [Methylophaga sp.]|nr:MAG: phosphate transport system regulatory protein PhoU [Gammaproteobacteria bacterium]HHA18509.1 phosphate signaling complex protein PhoU [Methylophaga sp.]